MEVVTIANYITKQCISCNNDFQIHYYQRNSIKTCSKDCSKRALSLSKMKGQYFLCDMCDKPIYLSKSSVNAHNFCSRNCDHNYRRDVQALGTTIKEGTAPRKKYYGSSWYKICRAVRKEQGYTCLDCRVHEDDYGKALSVHHLKPFVTFDNTEEANKRTNLVGICEPCHRARHSGDGHIAKLPTSSLGDNAYAGYGDVRGKDRIKALHALRLLITTTKTLGQIAEDTNLSRGTVSRIYHGERWTDLYTGQPPIKTHPRGKSSYSKFSD